MCHCLVRNEQVGRESRAFDCRDKQGCKSLINPNAVSVSTVTLFVSLGHQALCCLCGRGVIDLCTCTGLFVS